MNDRALLVTRDVVSLSALLGIKLAGYIGVAYFLNRRLTKQVNPFLFGLLRTGAGVLVQVVTLSVLVFTLHNLGYILALPVSALARFGEWYLFIWYFYVRGTGQRVPVKYALLATVWSFVLDLPAMLFGATLYAALGGHLGSC